MQPALDLLTEDESASIAGVTKDTLRKYVSYGLLDFITDDNGRKLLSRDELNDIFQIENSEPSDSEAPVQLFEVKKELEDNIILIGSYVGGQEAPRLDKKAKKKKEENKGPIPLSARSSDSSLELIEINAHLRDRVKSLRAERDWLRERVEKLEQQLEREQTLLMAESETVRRLISLHSGKRAGIANTVKRLLGWDN